MLSLTNLQHGEEVYQRCVLVIGECAVENSFILIKTVDRGEKKTFPDQYWPVSNGHFKALLMLAPGPNRIYIHPSSKPESFLKLSIRYTPLLQNPPLHLAIFIAKDSPLLVDCPPFQMPSLSSTHSSLSAVIAKFRITALMWQAFTAEEFRRNGLQRRSFRLEEEWVPPNSSTLSKVHLESDPYYSSVPRIHLIRTEQTVADLRQPERAMDNPQATDEEYLFRTFSAALKAQGSPFDAGPVTVVGLILDSHFDVTRNFTLAYAGLGQCQPESLSLGIYGSHLTYAWPRFIEEVTSCLMDGTKAGSSVYTGKMGEPCPLVIRNSGKMWQSCALGQASFLHEAGHAFGALHSSGIMVPNGIYEWAECFLPSAEVSNRCFWDVGDLLKFKVHAAFTLPADAYPNAADPVIEALGKNGESVRVKCEAGIGVVKLNGETEQVTSLRNPVKEVTFTTAELKKRFGGPKPLELMVVGMNGKDMTWLLPSQGQVSG